MSVLQIRLKNCLQTILDLQPSMHKVYRANFAEDFSQLKAYLMRVDNMDLREEDVERLEHMTIEFLKEARFASFRPPVAAGRLQ